MSAIEREHVMPPRPLMPWTMALCAGLCASCGLVLNAAADVLLGERAAPVTLLMAIPFAAATCIVLARSCMRLVRWKRWLYAAALPRCGSGRVCGLGDRGTARIEGTG